MILRHEPQGYLPEHILSEIEAQSPWDLFVVSTSLKDPSGPFIDEETLEDFDLLLPDMNQWC